MQHFRIETGQLSEHPCQGRNIATMSKNAVHQLHTCDTDHVRTRCTEAVPATIVNYTIAGRRCAPRVPLQLGLSSVCFITAVAGVQIWAEYAQSLPVPGITATDAYTLHIFGAGLLCGNGLSVSL